MYGKLGGVILIKMPLFNPPNLTGGVDEVIVDVVREVPSFTIGLLLFVFGVIFLGGISTQKRRTGFADYPMWAVTSSLSVLVITLILTIKQGLISLDVLGIVVAITIFSGLWLFLSKGRGEV